MTSTKDFSGTDKTLRPPERAILFSVLRIKSCNRYNESALRAKEDNLQRKESGTAQITAPGIVQDVVISGTGKNLDDNTQAFMENRFGYDFGNILNGSLAAKSATSVNAHAYTSGNQIVFNEGKYNPSTNEGKKLLAHELTHVVQRGKRYCNQTCRNDNLLPCQRQHLPAPTLTPTPAPSPSVAPRVRIQLTGMGTICANLDRTPRPTSVAGAQALASSWFTNMPEAAFALMLQLLVRLIQAAIATHEEGELQLIATDLRDYFSNVRPERYRHYTSILLEGIREDCRRKQREIAIEFQVQHYP